MGIRYIRLLYNTDVSDTLVLCFVLQIDSKIPVNALTMQTTFTKGLTVSERKEISCLYIDVYYTDIYL